MVEASLERVVLARYDEVGTLRHQADAFLHESSDDELREKLLLVVSELCTNAIDALANPSAEFTLRVRDLQGCVVVEVEDRGPGFRNAFSKPGAGDEAERGRGLAVVQTLVDEFSVVRRDGRTLVRCVLNR